MRQLGRVFDLSGPAVGKRLDQMLLRSEGRPTQEAIRLGIGRLLPSSAHLQTPVVQWHGVKAIRALEDSGLVPQDPFGVFCRAAVDKVRTAFLGFRSDEVPGDATDWWITHQIQGHMDRIPDNRTEDFIDTLAHGVLTTKGRKVRPELMELMLDAMGELEAHLARIQAIQLRAGPVLRETAPSRPRGRL